MAVIDTLTAKTQNWLKKTGDTMIAGFLTLFQDPTEDFHAVTKRYVDNLVGAGATSGNFLGTITQNGLATSTSVLGLPSPTATGASTLVDDATGAYINYASAGTAGWLFGVPASEVQLVPDTIWTIKTGLDITNIRMWVGMSGADIALSDANDGGAGSTNIIAFRFSTNVPDTNWVALTDRLGGVEQSTDTGIPVVADTRYVMRLDASTVGTVRFYINGTLVATHTGTIPTAAGNLSLIALSRSLNGASHSIRIRRVQQTSL